MAQSNLIHFDTKHRRLFIEQPLAVLMMRNADTWMNFLKGVHLWHYSRECQRAWDSYMQREELAAVRAANKQHASLSRADIDRIRRARRDEISISDQQPPAPAPYEYFIIHETTDPSAAMPSQPSPPAAEILAVGHYDPATGLTELATWEEVSRFMSAN